MSREEVALRIGDDFVARKFGETTSEEILDHAIRVAMALLTEGVVAAPTEGIAKIGLGKNDDGTQYLMIYYAGPIRSAGGTAQALSVLVGDYVRQKLGISRYIPRQEEVERYIEEIRHYNSIMNLQYLPSEAEIRLIIENCPVCIDGEATEQEEVSGHRNLGRVETNGVRGGMALVIGEGIAGKARKLKSRVEKMKMEGWEWLDTLIAGAAKGGEGEKTVGIKPLDKYLRDLIGGRPVFSYPMRKGGFRLRYGRSRNTGFAAAGMHPATLYVLGEFLATGTQMKTERPGKACGVVPVDSIEGPTVRLQNGDVLRIDDEATAQRLAAGIEKILDVGEILISYGEFLENNHPLVPAGYCGEWWQLDAGDGVKPPEDEPEALEYARKGGYLYPAWTWFWDDITTDRIRALAEHVSTQGTVKEDGLHLPNDPAIKESLETILIPHEVRDDTIVLRTYLSFIAGLGLARQSQKAGDMADHPSRRGSACAGDAPERDYDAVPVRDPDRRPDGQAGQIETPEDEPATSRPLPARRFGGEQALVPVRLRPHGGSGRGGHGHRFPERGRDHRDRGRPAPVHGLQRDHLPEPVRKVRGPHGRNIYLPEMRAGDHAGPVSRLQCPGHLQPAGHHEHEGRVWQGDGAAGDENRQRRARQRGERGYLPGEDRGGDGEGHPAGTAEHLRLQGRHDAV